VSKDAGSVLDKLEKVLTKNQFVGGANLTGKDRDALEEI